MDLLALLENVASPDPRDAMDMTDNRVCLERRVNREWYRHRDPKVSLVSAGAARRESPAAVPPTH